MIFEHVLFINCIDLFNLRVENAVDDPNFIVIFNI